MSVRLAAFVLAGALLLTVGVVALGLALAAAEGRQEEALLQAVGSLPSTSRRVRVVQAATIAALGGVLGIPVGFAPTAAHLAGSSDGPIVFPTTAALAVAVVIPAVAAVAALAGGWLAGRSPVTAALLSDE